jgi:hypothetical protein
MELAYLGDSVVYHYARMVSHLLLLRNLDAWAGTASTVGTQSWAMCLQRKDERFYEIVESTRREKGITRAVSWILSKIQITYGMTSLLSIL